MRVPVIGCMFVLVASLVALPVSRADVAPKAPLAQASVEHAPANETVVGPPGTTALSYRAQYLAWTRPHAGRNELMLASWTGSNAHKVAIPGNCSVAGLRWAPNWNKLAVLTRCATVPTGTKGARGAIWVLDVHAGTPPRKVADLHGFATCVQWTRNGERIAFLYAPGTARQPSATGSCSLHSGMDHRYGEQALRVAIVAASGGKPKIITPPSLDVSAYQLSSWGHRMVYAATAAPEDGKNAAAGLYVQDDRAGAVPRLIVDTSKAGTPLHGEWLALPRWSPSGSRILFLGGPKHGHAMAGRNLYSVPASGGTPVNLTATKKVKPAWFRFTGAGFILVTQVVDGKVEVVSYRLHGGFIRQRGRLWFTLPHAIGNGRYPFGISFAPRGSAWNLNRRSVIAYVQSLPGQAAELHSGVLITAPPPAVE